jgi:hypothetical protein
MRPRRIRDGSSTSRRAESHHNGRRTQNLPSENPSDQTIQDEDIVDGNLTTSELVRRQKLPVMSIRSAAGQHIAVINLG